MIADDFKQFFVSILTKSNIVSLMLVVLIKLGMSLSLMFGIPGIQSIGMFRALSVMDSVSAAISQIGSYL